MMLKIETEVAIEIHIAFYQTARHDIMQVATQYFHRLKLHESIHKNDVLIYILEKDRRFVILGDAGIHQKVPANYWEDLSIQLSAEFKNGNFYQGLVQCISQISEDMKQHYPKETKSNTLL